MATFTNQTTNLSNLSAALGALCRGLEAPIHNSTGEAATAREEAEEFLDTIIDRVDLVDEALMKSTEHLLPTLTGRGEPSRMTATELSQLLSSLHAANAQKMEQLERFLEGSSPSPVTPNKQQQQQQLESQEKTTTPHHWFLGLPLDKVVETDNETDRYSCSSASVVKSPSVSNTPSRPLLTPGTPCTPSIAELRLSASTAKILTKEIIDHNSPDAASASKFSMFNKAAEVSFQDGNYWSRYMGDVDQSIDYRDTSAYEATLASTKDEKESEPASIFVNENASLDEEEGEEEDEDSNAEESTICSTVVAEGRVPRPRFHSRPIPEEEADDYTLGESTICSLLVTTRIDEAENENSQDDDDVTTLCPTIVANQNQLENPVRSERIGASKFSTYQHDLSQVELDNDISQSHTFLTMDGTMYFDDPTEVVSRQSSRYANDAASLGEETPVLDRYRIDPDDSSVGFKVVPNQRGSSRRKARTKETSYLSGINNSTFDTDQVVPKTVKFHDRSVPGSNEEDQRQAFRKTPYPKAAGWASSSSRGEEEQSMASLHTHSSYQAARPIVDESHFDSRIRFDVSTPTNQGDKKTFRKTPLPSKWNDGDDESAENETSKVHFEAASPFKYLTTPAKQHRTTFRKTPYPKSDVSPSLEQNLRFDIGTDAAESTTPAKTTKAIYRKTPHSKIYDDTSSQSSSVRFSNQVRFDIETPAKSTQQTYRKTPFATRTIVDDASDSLDTNDRVRFDVKDRSFSSVTCRSTSAKKMYRKTPYQNPKGALSQVDENTAVNNAHGGEYDLHDRIKSKGASSSNPQRSPLVDLSPTIGNRSSTPQHIQIMNHEMVTSPMSLSSTLTGITGLTYAKNNRELFPAKELPAVANLSTPGSRLTGISDKVKKAPEFATPRKSSSALIPRVTESELAQASPVVKMQANLDEVNKAISALNGAAFLKQNTGSEDEAVVFGDAEAYKILRNCGFKRRRCKGMLMSLCHFRRLVMRENVEARYDDDDGQHFFEVVSYGQTYLPVG